MPFCHVYYTSVKIYTLFIKHLSYFLQKYISLKHYFITVIYCVDKLFTIYTIGDYTKKEQTRESEKVRSHVTHKHGKVVRCVWCNSYINKKKTIK